MAAEEDIKIKDPDAPASKYQMELIHALAGAGVVTQAELTSLGDAPTKEIASMLIDSHSDEEGFKAVQEARRSERAAQRVARKDASAQNTKKSLHVNVPVAFVRISDKEMEGKYGPYRNAWVNVPRGTKIGALDASGYAFDVKFDQTLRNDLARCEVDKDGKKHGLVTVTIKTREVVGKDGKTETKAELWKKSNDQGKYERIAVNPWNIVNGIKANNEAYKAAKNAESAQTVAGPSAAEVREAAAASPSLAGAGAGSAPAQKKSSNIEW